MVWNSSHTAWLSLKMGDRRETVTVYLCLFNILECIFLIYSTCAVCLSLFCLFFLKKITYHSHMNIRLLVSKTFQTMYCTDKISLSHNSPWPGCIICDYSRIVGQWVKQRWSWWATFHFWKKMVDWDAHLCWKKNILSPYLHILCWLMRWLMKDFYCRGLFFFTLCLCIFLLNIQYYHENNTK